MQKKPNVLFSTSMLNKINAIKHQNRIAEMLSHPDLYCDFDTIHHITLRDGDEVVSFMPKGKDQVYNDDGTWSRQGRQTMKIGRMVRTLLLEETIRENAVRDTEIEVFVNLMKTQYESKPPFEFKLVEGEDIRWWYNADRYASYCGTLGDSCMRYSESYNWLKIYSDNTDKIKMLCMVGAQDRDYSGRLIARAIVWKGDDGETYMDRIYSIADKYVLAMKAEAMQRGWYFKMHQGNDSQDEWTLDGNHEIQKAVRVTLKYTDYHNYPYMDTFDLLHHEPDNKTAGFVLNTMHNHDGIILSEIKHNVTRSLKNSGGGYMNCAYRFCTIDKTYYRESDCVQIVTGTYAGQWAMSGHTRYINYTDEKGEIRSGHVWMNDLFRDFYSRGYFLKAEAADYKDNKVWKNNLYNRYNSVEQVHVNDVGRNYLVFPTNLNTLHYSQAKIKNWENKRIVFVGGVDVVQLDDYTYALKDDVRMFMGGYVHKSDKAYRKWLSKNPELFADNGNEIDYIKTTDFIYEAKKPKAKRRSAISECQVPDPLNGEPCTPPSYGTISIIVDEDGRPF